MEKFQKGMRKLSSSWMCSIERRYQQRTIFGESIDRVAFLESMTRRD